MICVLMLELRMVVWNVVQNWKWKKISTDNNYSKVYLMDFSKNARVYTSFISTLLISCVMKSIKSISSRTKWHVRRFFLTIDQVLNLPGIRHLSSSELSYGFIFTMKLSFYVMCRDGTLFKFGTWHPTYYYYQIASGSLPRLLGLGC